MIEGIMWFKEDLRIRDNTALVQLCEKVQDGIMAVYVISHQAWKKHDIAPIRIDFILRNLAILREELALLNIPLQILEISNDEEIPQKLLELCRQYQTRFVFFNRQYELDELRRDKAVSNLLTKNNIQVKSFSDQVFFEPGKILSQKQEFLTIYTPFKNTCLKFWQEQGFPTVLKKPKPQKPVTIKSTAIPKKISNIPIRNSENWPAGEMAAEKRLKKFSHSAINNYQHDRDFPSLDGTSKMSVYLASGIISPRQCLHAANTGANNSGTNTWINELLWREFYKHISYAFPRVCMNKPFRLHTDKLNWSYDKNLFSLWQQGQTGFPIVDAGLRQLKETGWMHNRVRMITAMFLTKLLMIDWRWGEKYFMQQLIDGDFSANNGNWQWCASTGTDAVPYFRIFNPLLQSQKFDPRGDYIQQYCPELKNFDAKTIHEPYAFSPELAKKANYPKPIIDYKTARQKTLNAFKSLKTS